jgi:hypothetical protein
LTFIVNSFSKINAYQSTRIIHNNLVALYVSLTFTFKRYRCHSDVLTRQRFPSKSQQSKIVQYNTSYIPVHAGCPRTRSPEKKGEISKKGQTNNRKENIFLIERFSRKEHFHSTNQSVLSHSVPLRFIFSGICVKKSAIVCLFFY